MLLPTRVLNTHLRSDAGTGGVWGSLPGSAFLSFPGTEPHQARQTPGCTLAAGEPGGRAKGQVAGEGEQDKGREQERQLSFPFCKARAAISCQPSPSSSGAAPHLRRGETEQGRDGGRLKLWSRMRVPSGAFLLIFISKDYFSRGNCLN